MRAANPGAARADAGKVITHATATPHGFGRLGQRGIDAGMAVLDVGDRVAYGLHKTVDQGGRQISASGGLNSSSRQKPVLQGLQKFGFPFLLLLWRLYLSQSTRNALIDLKDGLL